MAVWWENRVKVLGAVGLGLLAAVAYWLLAQGLDQTNWISKVSGAQRQPIVRIAYIQDPSSSLILLARAKGFFAERGLRVEFRPHSNAMETILDVLSGRADYAHTSSGPFISAIADGARLEVLTETHLSMRSAYFLTRSSDAPIGLSDFRTSGKKVVVVEREPDDFMLNLYLLSQGLDLKSPQLVRANFEEADRLFRSGAVDILLLWQSYGPNPNFSPTSGFRTEEVTGIPDFSFLVKRAEEESSGRDDRLLEALYDAQTFLVENRTAANQLIASELGVAAPSGHADWPKQLEPSLGLSTALVRMLHEELKAEVAQKQVDSDILSDILGRPTESLLRSLLSPSALLKVSPRSVTTL